MQKRERPWVDKYRPKSLDEIIEQTEIIKVLKNTVDTGNLPHLLLYGPPGTGKTSCILAIAKQLFGPEKFNERVIELNASDDRGINTVRDKIDTFAKASIGTPDPKYPSPDYKIIILDEADAMTTDAQDALRDIIESTSKITRFCFICNFIDKVIEPIASRCVKFRFKSISVENMSEKLDKIAKNEKIKISADALYRISVIADGDVRRGIMLLQHVQYLTKIKKTIEASDVDYISGMIDKDVTEKLWKDLEMANVKDIVTIATKISREAYPINIVLDNLKGLIMKKIKNEKDKSKLLIELSCVETKLLDGADEYLQLLRLLVTIKETL